MGKHEPIGARDRDATADRASAGKVATAVLHVGGLRLGGVSEKAVVERVLSRRPGVRLMEANPVAQTATVTFDTGQTSVAERRRWFEERGFHCADQSVPSHICDPTAEPDPPGGVLTRSDRGWGRLGWRHQGRAAVCSGTGWESKAEAQPVEQK